MNISNLSGQVMGAVKASRVIMKKVSNRQRRKILGLNDQDASAFQRCQWRDYPVEDVKRIAQKVSKNRTPTEVEVLREVLSNVTIFQNVSKEGLRVMAAEVQLRLLQPGEILCEQGEHGDVMWVIVQGRLEAWLDGRPAPLKHTARFARETDDNTEERSSLPAGEPQENRPRKLSRSATLTSVDMNSSTRSRDIGTMINVSTPTAPGYLGELALLQGTSTRTCTIRAGLPEDAYGAQESELETVLLQVTRKQFENTAIRLVQEQKNEKMRCLRNCAALKGLPSNHLSKLVYYMEKRTISANTTVAHKGQPVTGLYLVIDGECKCLDDCRETLQPSTPYHAGTARDQNGDSSTHKAKTKMIKTGRSRHSNNTADLHAQTSSRSESQRNHNSTNPIEMAMAALSRRPRTRSASQRASMLTQESKAAAASIAASSGASLPLHVAPPLQAPLKVMQTPRSHGACHEVEIAQVGPGHMIGDVEMARPGSGGVHHAHHGSRVWKHSYVTVGPLTCYVIKPHDFEKRILDHSHFLYQQLAEDVALKMSWREQTLQRRLETPRYAVAPKKPHNDEHHRSDDEGGNDGGKTVRIPTPPLGPRNGTSRAKPGVLTDRYGSAITLTSKSVSNREEAIASTGSSIATPEQKQGVSDNDDVPISPSRSPDTLPSLAVPPETLPAYPSLSYAILPSRSTVGEATSTTSKADLSEWSWASLQEEHKANHMASQRRLGTYPHTCSGRPGGLKQRAKCVPTGSVTLGLGGRVAWGGSRVARRCPFFIEPPEALRFAETKDVEQQQHIMGQPSYKAALKHRGSGSNKGSSSARLPETSSSVSSFPRAYSARTGRAAAGPRFPAAAPALPTLAPLRTL